MKTKLSKTLLVALIIVVLTIILRETFWVVKDSTQIDDHLTVEIAIDTAIFTWLDPDTKKEIKITNERTGASLEILIHSIEYDLFFFIDEHMTLKDLRIADKYLGQNKYDYMSLKPINEHEDCFDKDNRCGGFDSTSFSQLGEPVLKYSIEGFER